jgi:hypothetical protein
MNAPSFDGEGNATVSSCETDGNIRPFVADRALREDGSHIAGYVHSNGMPPVPPLPSCVIPLPPNKKIKNERRGPGCDAPESVKSFSSSHGYPIAHQDSGMIEEAAKSTETINLHVTSENTAKEDTETKQPAQDDWLVETLFELKNTATSVTSSKIDGMLSNKRAAGKKRKSDGTSLSCTKKAATGKSAAMKPDAATTSSNKEPKKHETTWNLRLDELRQFKQLHGHTNVPQKYEKNPRLGEPQDQLSIITIYNKFTFEPILTLSSYQTGAWVARNRLFMRQWEDDPPVVQLNRQRGCWYLKIWGCCLR